MPRRPIVAAFVAFAAASAALAREPQDDKPAPAPAKAAEPVRFGPPPEDLRLEIQAPKSSYWPGESIRPEVALVNGSKKDVPVVLPRWGSDLGASEPWLSWTAAYVAADGTETPVTPRPHGDCRLGIDFVWQDDVVALKAGARVALSQVEEPAHRIELPAPGKVRLRLRYAYSAGKAPRALAIADFANVPKDTGAMGAQEPYELVGVVDVTIVRPLDVVIEQVAPIRAGAETRLADVLRVRAVGKDSAARTLPASRWWVRIEFEACSDVGLDSAKCGARREFSLAVAVPPGAMAPVPLEPSMTCKAARAGTCRARAVLYAFDGYVGSPRIVSEWTEVRVTE